MKMTGSILTGMLAAASVALPGCKPTSDKVPKADESTPRLQASAPPVPAPAGTNDRATVQQKLSARMSELDAKMAELKESARNAGAKAKAEWEARRPQLEAQREAAAKKLRELNDSDAWQETRAKTEAAFAELEKGFKDAWAKLKE